MQTFRETQRIAVGTAIQTPDLSDNHNLSLSAGE
jgi:hypothetical protein